MAHRAGVSPPARDRLHHDPAASAPSQTTANTKLSDPPKRRPSSAHKRSVSANLLSKLPFLRNSWDDLPSAHAHAHAHAHADRSKEEARPTDDGQPKRNASMALAQAVRQSASSSSGRRRRGSLRKTAILGTRQRSSEHQSQRAAHSRMDSIATSPTSPDRPGKIHSLFSYGPYANPSATSSSESGWSQGSSHMLSSTQLEHDTPRPQVLASPISSPVTSPVANPYASTTDDDNDSLSFRHPQAANGHLSPSYFSMQSVQTSTLQRRRSAKTTSTTRHSSPLSLPPATLDLDEWDYSETEWWGWVVLIVTWIVFVVGMGSCLEVWSWAWDVGETPYAPPELEDDPTLPIVGYYPALMVLTAVMAWVWVVVAWVGMKYFRHAKVVGEDG